MIKKQQQAAAPRPNGRRSIRLSNPNRRRRSVDKNGNPHDLNHLSHSGAVDLARRLRKYWLDRGYNVRTTVESIDVASARALYGVRSNLVGGIPPIDIKIVALDAAA